MSVQSVFRRSLHNLRQSNSPSFFISSFSDLHSNGSLLRKLCCRSLLRNSKCISLPKQNSLRILACQKRGFASQPSSQTQTTIGISSGNLAEQVLKSKIESEAKQDSQSDEKGSQEAGQGQDEEDKKAAANQIRALKFTMYAMGGMFLGTGLYIFFSYGAPMEDEKGNPISDEFSHLPFVQQYGKRASAEVNNYIKYIVNPSRDKLLPDPVKAPYHQPPYTLLIELTGVLVHPDWTYKTGWRFKKRPGIDFFLNAVAGYQFEVVIYTCEPGLTAFPIIDALDQQGLIHYRLFRDSTKYENGIHLKDLDKINRDLSKVIVVDCNEKSVQNHRNNAIVLPRWRGNDDDRALFDLATLLQTIGNSEVKDIRGVLEYYSDYADPIAEFRRKQMVLAQREQDALKKAETKVTTGFNPAGGFLGSLFRKS